MDLGGQPAPGPSEVGGGKTGPAPPTRGATGLFLRITGLNGAGGGSDNSRIASFSPYASSARSSAGSS